MSKVKTIKTTVAEIGYEESGSELHLPVVLLHGFPDDVRTWDGVIERLSDLQIRILRPYLRGYGPTGVFFESARSGQVAALAQEDSAGEPYRYDGRIHRPDGGRRQERR